MPALLPESERKHPANLSLAPARLAFGHRYAEAHQTSLSQVVDDLLAALEGAVAAEPGDRERDPLDGLLAGWPEVDKKDLRREQHERRLAR